MLKVQASEEVFLAGLLAAILWIGSCKIQGPAMLVAKGPVTKR